MSSALSRVWDCLSQAKDIVNDYYSGGYLPLHNEKTDFNVSISQNEVLEHVHTREINVNALSKEGTLFQFTVTVLTPRVDTDQNVQEKMHTILRFAGNKEDKTVSMRHAISLISRHVKSDPLRVLQVDLYSTKIKRKEDKEYRQWKPLSSGDFGDLGYVINGLFLRGYKIDSFYFYAFGTTVFNGLDPSIAEHFADATLILDRGFTSSDTEGWRDLPWYTRYPVIIGSHLMGWSADIHHGLVQALSHLNSSNGPRIIILEDQMDPNGFIFNSNLEEDLFDYTKSVIRLPMQTKDSCRGYFQMNKNVIQW